MKQGSNLVDAVVHLVGHFLELHVGQVEVPLVGVEVSVLPAAPGLCRVHVVGQVEGHLQGLPGAEVTTYILLKNCIGHVCTV